MLESSTPLPSFPTSSPEKNSTGTTLSGASPAPLGRGRWSRLARDESPWWLSFGDFNHEKLGIYHPKWWFEPWQIGKLTVKIVKRKIKSSKMWLSLVVNTKASDWPKKNTKNCKLLGIKHGWLENNMFQHVGRKIVQWYNLQSHGGIAEGQLSGIRSINGPTKLIQIWDMLPSGND